MRKLYMQTGCGVFTLFDWLVPMLLMFSRPMRVVVPLQAGSMPA
jgi:hypothetical protein